jgi:excinuclease ABC subunit B
MAEELTDYLTKLDIRCAYIHSDVETMDRIKILDDLRAGNIDVLIGVNLLREGLDLPEVSLVAIIDADKEGFLRSHRSLTQTAGRAARNLNGEVIMYADKITESMQQTIDETERRRSIQLAYNEQNGITPQAIIKARNLIIGHEHDDDSDQKKASRRGSKRYETPAARGADAQHQYYSEFDHASGIAADPVVQYMSPDNLEKAIERLRNEMVAAAKKMDFIEAAQLRDEMLKMEEQLQAKTQNQQ